MHTAMIQDICKAHTNLSPSDIRQVEEVARILDAVADLMGADLFIDCPTRDRDTAIVVAQAGPSNGKSMYRGSVVGEFAHRKNEPAALRTLDVGMSTMDLTARTQENKDVRQNVSPIKNDSGEVIACLIAETDVTADQKNKRKVSMLSRTTEELANALVSTRTTEDGSIPDHLTDGILIFNPQGTAVFANPVAREIYRKLGYMNPLEGMAFSNLALEDMEFEDILGKKQMSSRGVKFGNRVLNLKYAMMTGDDESASGAVMLINDETDVKATEKELILKSVAIKEIHHRVKNNLQTIASLLRLQSRRIDNESAKKAFSESISRVLSIAATHEILAQNGVDDVNLTVMLKRIMHSVIGHSLETDRGIRISIGGDPIKTNSDVATSIALVVNELIQNCVKYAFVGRESGHIRVEIHRGETYSNIAIIDDGVGFDVNQDTDAGSLGRRIVQQLVADKLGGNLTVESGENGTKVAFDFFHDQNMAMPT